MIKAVGLLSGGLDSTLAAKLLLDQGIGVHAINFTSPFCACTSKGASCAAVVTAVKTLGDIPLQRIALGEEYLKMVQNPKHGYGRGLNPCIDCRIMKIKKAAEYMREIGASFLFTGEVLGQRPMSQHRRAIDLIDRETGLGDLTLRPLSALLFEPTLPERQGWIVREKLLAFSGKTRKPQIALALDKNITDYPCPAGGCRLTNAHFAERLRDYFAFCSLPSMQDIPLLKVGRHFRLPGGDKIVVSRDEAEGEMLLRLARPADHLLIPHFSGPVTLLQGKSLNDALDKMRLFVKVLPAAGAVVEHRCDGAAEMLTLSGLSGPSPA
ncbi:MAG: hypothetical protein PHC61_12715 [Chitinivibrionales bacterium]|nr:hypothetical protein [Chitinivibrionales bacterium]